LIESPELAAKIVAAYPRLKKIEKVKVPIMKAPPAAFSLTHWQDLPHASSYASAYIFIHIYMDKRGALSNGVLK
jgi:hypothetical protein